MFFFLPLRTDRFDGGIPLGGLGFLILMLVIALAFIHVRMRADASLFQQMGLARSEQAAEMNGAARAAEAESPARVGGLGDEESPAANISLAERAKDPDFEAAAPMASMIDAMSAVTGKGGPSFSFAEVRKAASKHPLWKMGLVGNHFSSVNLLTAPLVHAGFLHLFMVGILFFLFGTSLEQYWGTRWYFVFLAGAAVSVQLVTLGVIHLIRPEILADPIVGGSGIGLFLAGYFLAKFPGSKADVFWFYMIMKPKWGIFQIPSWLVLPLWVPVLAMVMVFTGGPLADAPVELSLVGLVLGLLAGKLLPTHPDWGEKLVSADLATPIARPVENWLGAEEAWSDLEKLEFDSCGHRFGQLFDLWCSDPAAHRAAIEKNLGKFEREVLDPQMLDLSTAKLVEWGRKLVGAHFDRQALYLYEWAARQEKDPHRLAQVIIAAAIVRMRAKLNAGRAEEMLRRVVDLLEPGDRLRVKAEEYLAALVKHDEDAV
jgi:membrane associated rhomboid family serine protease